MKFLRTVALASTLLVAAQAAARAEIADAEQSVAAVAVQPAPAVSRAHAIGVDVGFASAVGAFGLTFTQAFGEAFRLEAGVGVGFSGIQVSLMPKLVLGSPSDHFVSGVGIAYTFAVDGTVTDGNPVWLNIDALGYEHRFANGLAFSFALGITRGLGGGRFCVIECDGDADKSDVRRMAGPQARMGLAYWF